MDRPKVKWVVEGRWLDNRWQRIGEYKWRWLAELGAAWIALWCIGIEVNVWRQIEL